MSEFSWSRLLQTIILRLLKVQHWFSALRENRRCRADAVPGNETTHSDVRLGARP